ncbi:unnamed protein product [Gordionus sp. m RMFG-2023]|uniref:uncharacterized protein LOC135930350 n=1 Tax=Gordionus sp. m RMFG-2023 TaxID=3053472 RepID=UPI0030E003CF
MTFKFLSQIILVHVLYGYNGVIGQGYTNNNNQNVGNILASAMAFCQANVNCLAPRKCVSINNNPSLCQCPSPYILDPTTNSCGLPSTAIRVVVHMTRIRFKHDYLNADSRKYKELQGKFLSTIWLIILANSDAAGFILNVYVVHFLPGSVIVHADIVLKQGANRTADDIRRIFAEGLKRPPLYAPLNLTNSRIKAAYEKDPCVSGGVNLCPEPDTVCVSSHMIFKECRCKEGYQEMVEKETGFIKCSMNCPRDYCSNNGICEIKSNKKYCKCPDWYLGDRCQHNGFDIIVSLMTATIIFIIAGISVFAYYAKKKEFFNESSDDQASFKSSSIDHNHENKYSDLKFKY